MYRDDIPSNSTYVELDGLKSAVSYVVVMAARNLAGEGAVSSALSATTFESGKKGFMLNSCLLCGGSVLAVALQMTMHFPNLVSVCSSHTLMRAVALANLRLAVGLFPLDSTVTLLYTAGELVG